MEVKENRTTYHCDFCKKYLFNRRAMEKHEAICINNPINIRACLRCGGCEYLTMDTIEVSFERGYVVDEGYISDLQEKNVFKCDKLNKLMFPYSIERKNLHMKYPDTYQDQEPMPKECEHFTEQKYF